MWIIPSNHPITAISMRTNANPIYDKAYGMYVNGMSLQDVAKEIGVTRQCVYKAFKKRGFTLRSVVPRDYQTYDGKKFSRRSNGYYALTYDNRIFMHRYVWEKCNGLIPDGFDIHHIDEDKSNNQISNLECLPKSDHARKHGFRNNQHTIKRK